MKNKTYKLLKDLAYIKADAIYEKNETGTYICSNGKFSCKNIYQDTLSADVVENNPDWFEEVLPVSEPVKEVNEVYIVKFVGDSFITQGFGKPPYKLYEFLTTGIINKDKLPAIKQAIDDAINGKEDLDLKMYEKIMSEKTYSQSEVDTISKETAVNFAEFILKNSVLPRDTCWFDAGKHLSSEQLYTIYLSSLNNSEGKTIEHFKSARPIKQPKLIGVKICGNVDNYLESASIQLGSDGLPIVIAIRGNLFYPAINASWQPSNDNNFVWTDELINEFMNEGELNYYSWFNELRKFKQSKQLLSLSIPSLEVDSKNYYPPRPMQNDTVDKDWEIMQYKNKTNGEIFELASVWNNSYYKNGFKDRTGGFGEQQDVFEIHSVRRISDNCLFTVLDKLSGYGQTLTIEKFEIEGANLMKVCFNEGGFLPIDKMPLQPLSTQADNQPTISSDNSDVTCLTVNDVCSVYENWFLSKNESLRSALTKKAIQKLNEK